jgi:hypothetical protein
VQRAASILSNGHQPGIAPTTEAEIGLSPAAGGMGLREFDKAAMVVLLFQ